jgi:hypothetical protein
MDFLQVLGLGGANSPIPLPQTPKKPEQELPPAKEEVVEKYKK